MATIRGKQTRTAYLFLLLPLVYFSLIKVYPMVYNIYLSFHHFNMAYSWRWAGLENYKKALSDPLFWSSVRNTVYYGFFVVLCVTVLSLLTAVGLNAKLRGRVFFRTTLFLPSVVSVVVIATIWMWMYQPQAGLINYVLSKLGIGPYKWLDDPNLALPSIITVTIWQQVGYNMIIFLAGLQGIPSYLYESARIDGAGKLAQFWFITVPCLTPITFFVVVTTFIFTFRNFAIVYTMTQGGPLNSTNTLVYEIYRNSFQYLKGGYGAVFSVILLLICLLFSLISSRIARERGLGYGL